MIYIYLALVLFCAALSAFTDIRNGKVKNKHLIIVTSIWVGLIIVESIVTHTFPIQAIPFFINIILAFAVSLIFYLTDIWAPGDCKMYIVIAIIFPLRAYVMREGNIFPALDFVIYAFAIGYIALIGTVIYRQIKDKNNDRQEKIKPQLSLTHSLSILSNIGIITAVNITLNLYVPGFYYANQMLCILTVIGLICLLQKKADIVKHIAGYIGLGYFLVQTVINQTWISTVLSLIESLIIAAIIEIINSRARANLYREITGEEVRPGMILAFSTLWAMQNCVDPELPRTTTENRRSRLSRRQAEAVRTWCKNAKSNVVIVEMIPFAPFLASAVVVKTVLFLILGN